MNHYDMLIDGKLVGGDATMDVVNPATEQVFATVSRASEAQAEQAIQAAKRAFPAWSKTPIEERRKCHEKLADLVAENADNLARLLTQEQGKPLPEAQGEMAWTEGYLRHYATLDIPTRVIQDDEQGFIELRRKPLGVVAGIVAWNFPVLVACWKIGPATLAGNTIIVKPAPTTPATTLALASLAKEVFPDGVLNVIADDNDLGSYLTSHPDVAKVGFTGSTATGKKIMENSANSLKRLTLELGGNDPAIILDDVDVKMTAQNIFNNAFLNAGQVCIAVKRAYVHESIYDEMCNELTSLAEQAIVGDGLNQGTTIGPIQNKKQYEKVRNYLDQASKDGNVIAGGEVLSGEGYFVKPTIVRDVTDGNSIVDEEQFGPILPVIPFTDVDDVINRANNTEYGLGGSVWSQNEERGLEIADRIESGSVWVNQHLNIGPHIPMAGFKGSGVGVEQSVEGLEEYTQAQVVNVARQVAN